MLQDLAIELSFLVYVIKENLSLFLEIIAGVWLLNIINWMTGSKLNYLGVRPRKISGLIGIFTGTFLHANFNHLFFNSIPLFALGLLMLSFGLKTFLLISVFIMLVEGICVWLMARRGIHIGASALISGYFSFLVSSAYARPNCTSILIAAITLYYFGSIALGVFPSEEKVSWEGHLFGFSAGILAYYVIL